MEKKFTEKQIIDEIKSSKDLKDALDDKNLEKFARIAIKGQDIDLFKGIHDLVEGYLDNCGISISIRTVYYDAGQQLMEEFMKTSQPLAKELSEKKKKEGCVLAFSEAMDKFNHHYTGQCDDYDITSLDDASYLKICLGEIDGYGYGDCIRTQALCYGTWLTLYRYTLHYSMDELFSE